MALPFLWNLPSSRPTTSHLFILPHLPVLPSPPIPPRTDCPPLCGAVYNRTPPCPSLPTYPSPHRLSSSLWSCLQSHTSILSSSLWSCLQSHTSLSFPPHLSLPEQIILLFVELFTIAHLHVLPSPPIPPRTDCPPLCGAVRQRACRAAAGARAAAAAPGAPNARAGAPAVGRHIPAPRQAAFLCAGSGALDHVPVVLHLPDDVQHNSAAMVVHRAGRSSACVLVNRAGTVPACACSCTEQAGSPHVHAREQSRQGARMCVVMHRAGRVPACAWSCTEQAGARVCVIVHRAGNLFPSHAVSCDAHGGGFACMCTHARSATARDPILAPSTSLPGFERCGIAAAL
eukprot:365963-Chlamydomonas_euryale.AAC.8